MKLAYALAAAAAVLLSACGGGSETDAEFCARWRAANNPGGGGVIGVAGAFAKLEEPAECKG